MRRAWSLRCGCHVAGPLASQGAQRLESPRAAGATELSALHGNFNFTSGHDKGHSHLRPHGEAFADGISHIGFGLSFGTPLAHASRDGRALSDVDAVFVLVNRNGELHFSIITLGNMPLR